MENGRDHRLRRPNKAGFATLTGLVVTLGTAGTSDVQARVSAAAKRISGDERPQRTPEHRIAAAGRLVHTPTHLVPREEQESAVASLGGIIKATGPVAILTTETGILNRRVAGASVCDEPETPREKFLRVLAETCAEAEPPFQTRAECARWEATIINRILAGMGKAAELDPETIKLKKERRPKLEALRDKVVGFLENLGMVREEALSMLPGFLANIVNRRNLLDQDSDERQRFQIIQRLEEVSGRERDYAPGSGKGRDARLDWQDEMTYQLNKLLGTAAIPRLPFADSMGRKIRCSRERRREAYDRLAEICREIVGKEEADDLMPRFLKDRSY
ncbi:hypothetical protein HY605_04900 [Candidatus Peregrinibacteria bacterium]|nr:hypothetical protein [Candidatus Peregrinibacteria bacterium]